MKILLINPEKMNRWAKPPLGLLSVGTVCKKEGHEVDIIDGGITPLTLCPGTPYMLERYDLIGLTAMTSQIKRALNLAQFIKSMTKVPLIIGGVHASLFPQQLYDTGLFNAIVAGEGEKAIVDLVTALTVLKFHPSIYKTIEPVSIPKLDYGLIDVTAYKPRFPHGARLNWTTAQTSRGCPFSCTFCCNIFGHKYRYMPTEDVIQMLSELYCDYDIRDITFYDDEFTLDQERVLELCRTLAALNIDLTWTCESRVDMLNKKLLEAMGDAGCRLIYLGIESGNQDILKRLNKTIDLSKVKQVVKLMHEVEIKAAGYFMLGCPGETKETMQQTIDFALDSKLDHAQFSMCSPLPGSQLYEEYGGDHDWDKYQYLADAPKVTCATELTYAEIEEAVTDFNDAFRQEGVKH